MIYRVKLWTEGCYPALGGGAISKLLGYERRTNERTLVGPKPQIKRQFRVNKDEISTNCRLLNATKPIAHKAGRHEK